MSNYWRCKACGSPMSTKEYERVGGFCMECRNE